MRPSTSWRACCAPEALAGLLEAPGQVALERAGAILDERVPETVG